MIVFLVKSGILHYLADYLHHVQSYLKERFDVSADIKSYQPGTVPPVEKYEIVIFVQWVDPTIFSRLTSPTLNKSVVVPPTNPPRLHAAFQTRRALPQRGGHIPKVALKAEPKPTPMEKAEQPKPTPMEKAEQPKPTPMEKAEQPKHKIFLLNTEQATMTRYVSKTIADIKRYKVPVIDYSIENIMLLKRKLPETKFIHFPFPMTPKPLTPKKTAVVSLLSSLHRKTVCNSLGVSVANFNGKWGKSRDQMINDSKVLINIHYKPGDYGIFESIRCYHALEMRTLVISEPSISQNNVLLKDYIIFAPAGQMAAKLKDVLANYQVYYDQCFSEARIQEIEERFERVYRKSIDEIMTI